MLEKTKLIFLEDTKDMWIHYLKFKRSKSSVLAIMEKFYLMEWSWNIDFHRDMFIFYMKYDEKDESDEELDLDEIFMAEVENLRGVGFDVSFHDKRKFYISMDNLVEAVTQNYINL